MTRQPLVLTALIPVFLIGCSDGGTPPAAAAPPAEAPAKAKPGKKRPTPPPVRPKVSFDT